jgi:hypothetical protein
MASVLASSAVDRGCEPRSGQNKACTILVIVIDSSFVEQVEEQGIYLSKY